MTFCLVCIEFKFGRPPMIQITSVENSIEVEITPACDAEGKPDIANTECKEIM
jgi:hypothetical protein